MDPLYLTTRYHKLLCKIRRSKKRLDVKNDNETSDKKDLLGKNTSRGKILLMFQKTKRIFNESKVYKEQNVSSSAFYHIRKLKNMKNILLIIGKFNNNVVHMNYHHIRWVC